MKFKPLVIGDLVAPLPVVQGGMAVGVSLSGLAGAVAGCGGVGIIATAQIGFLEDIFERYPMKANLSALAKHLTAAKAKAKGGVIGVNIMAALKNYDEFVKCSVENGADLIISGAGLPVDLPSLVENSKTKIAPIVSSVKAATVLLKTWEKRYKKTADAIVVEGPKAGGHLAFSETEAVSRTDFDDELKKIIEFIKTYEEKFRKHIPVIFGGGVFDGRDTKRFIGMGCDGVQVATRFVATDECDAHMNYKEAYVKAGKDDVGIIKSPVGMPGRAIMNSFTRRTGLENIAVEKCLGCLKRCDPKTTPYCITKALIDAVKGDVENGLVFCGENVYRIDRMSNVKEVLDDLVTDENI